ncbi:restriction endonuclease [Streptomyces sp. FT05W]|nr:TIGR02391 family protein [Streptomyces sp. FT05W]PWS48207.1 restriction endonuclease [Streptomyces sp. FT05W]
MTQINREWVITKLETFISVAELKRTTNGFSVLANPLTTVQAEAQITEHILDRVLPRWRTADWPRKTTAFWREREAAHRAIAQLHAEQELADNLGSGAPQLDASTMHPWVWGSIQGLWSSGHYRQAVGMAATAVNAQTQTKVSRRDLAESRLFGDVFSTKPPEPGKPRLRLSVDDGSDTWRSRHDGAAAFARGVYAAIRNPIAHEVGDELKEHEALEQLAAFSLLARWVDDSTVETVV